MTTLLELRNVTRRFGGLTALSHVDMGVAAGRVTGLIGPNGAGKTTLINCVSGLDHPTEGAITFDHKAIHKWPPHRVTAAGIARTYQNIRLFDELTVLENMLVGHHLHSHTTILDSLVISPRYRREQRALREQSMVLLERFGLEGLSERLAGGLAYGEQRRLEMARALSTRPSLLLLDEPTAGMNPIETQEFGEQVIKTRSEGLAILVVEHDMALISQVCDEVYVLNFGKIIAQGTPDEIKNDPKVVEAYLGADEGESW